MTIDNNEIYFEPSLMRKAKKETDRATYIIIGLAVAVLLFDYFVLPQVLAHYGV